MPAIPKLTYEEMTSLREQIHAILSKPFDHEGWSLQGFGMLRLYLSPDKKRRLHIWHDGFRVPEVDSLHNHPWNFTSAVISGRLHNMRFEERPVTDEFAATHQKMIIKCGVGTCAMSEPELARLYQCSTEVYSPGDRYFQASTEIHDTKYDNGTITVCDREFDFANVENAAVYWALNRPWISAEPRPATVAEVAAITASALAKLEGKW